MIAKQILITLFMTCCFLACNNKPENTTETKDTISDTTKIIDSTAIINNAITSICGIDISKYQGNEIDYLNRKQDKLTFIICKATEGVTYTDPDFASNWKITQEKGFTRGCYHFYHCTDNPIDQANNYLNTIGTLSKNDFPPIVDFEEASIDKNCDKTQIQKNLLSFLTILQQKTGRMPLLYTDPNTGNNILTDTAFSKYYLWIADYNKGTTPKVPNVWKNKNWTFWQKSDNYTQVDSLVENDYDIFNGTPKEFFNFINKS